MSVEIKVCPKCGKEIQLQPGLSVRCVCGELVTRTTPKPQPIGGPGTELMALLETAMGVKAEKGCSCKARAAQMNKWGVQGCKANRAVIISWLEDAKRGFGVAGLIGAGIRAAWNGLPLTIPGLVDRAIELAEEKQPKPKPVDARQFTWACRGLLGAIQIVEDLHKSGAECTQVALLKNARDRLDAVITAVPVP